MRQLLLILCGCFLGACAIENPPSPSDSGPPRSDGGGDAGALDAGATDAGLDAGIVDAGIADAGQPQPVGCVSSIAAGHHAFACSSVTYEVEIPTACAGGGCGVVFDVHGATMNAAGMEKSTGLRALGRDAGYVIVQPTAPLTFIGNSWTPSTDDPKVWAFAQDLLKALVINPKRIHFTGFSQGGAMTWRMACAHADVLASVAPVAAADGQSLTSSALDCPFDATDSPSRQLPILQMHGTADGMVPFSKGQQQRDAVVAKWALGAPTLLSSDSKYSHKRYTNGNGTVYEFLQHDYVVPPQLISATLQGHCLPGGNDLQANASLGQTTFFSCAPPNAFTWGALVMKFFVDHPRP